MTQRDEALKWWNKLPILERKEFCEDYFATDLLCDDEIIYIYIKEVPQEKLYREEEVQGLCMEAYNQARRDGKRAWLGTFDEWWNLNKK